MIILESKVQIPVLPQVFTPRSRLRETLESGMTRSRLVLVSAPAGYGKTTLLADWAHASSLPVAWLTITGEEGDVEGFLRYLFAAWERAQPEVTKTSLGIHFESSSLDVKVILSEFVNAASRMPNHLIFVLDDFHLLTDQGVYEAVTFLLDHLPANPRPACRMPPPGQRARCDR
ncbi:MAG TPA: AAA family ATPase [Anaerolineales bacterium]|nr:AAA family ATPase [Anaerolineales bacterium]